MPQAIKHTHAMSDGVRLFFDDRVYLAAGAWRWRSSSECERRQSSTHRRRWQAIRLSIGRHRHRCHRCVLSHGAHGSSRSTAACQNCSKYAKSLVVMVVVWQADIEQFVKAQAQRQELQRDPTGPRRTSTHPYTRHKARLRHNTKHVSTQLHTHDTSTALPMS